jgi:organic radical activating enzyme
MHLNESFTSTGSKFFAHEEAMSNLRDGRGQPIVTHVMLTDICNHRCAFCSVQARPGDSLPMDVVLGYVDILVKYGLKAVILSGGGNPILYRCPSRKVGINQVVEQLRVRGLEVGLITNGMPLRSYEERSSWKTVSPTTLDQLTWVRVSMSGLDHEEREVYVPDVNPKRTALGFSYVAHDIYNEPEDPYHGKVSRKADLQSGPLVRPPDHPFEARREWLLDKFVDYCRRHEPRYLRLLPNCLEPELIPARAKQLRQMADAINFRLKKSVAFVQYKPPAPPKACYLGYIHPVLNCDGYVYPCDSCVLNEAAGHQFANPWRVCRWDEVARIYEEPVRSLIADPKKTCPGCVFTKSNEILGGVVDGSADLTPPTHTPEHVNFV